MSTIAKLVTIGMQLQVLLGNCGCCGGIALQKVSHIEHRNIAVMHDNQALCDLCRRSLHIERTT